jgi:hypothetical protein
VSCGTLLSVGLELLVFTPATKESMLKVSLDMMSRQDMNCPICGRVLAQQTQQIRADDEGEALVSACPDHASAVLVVINRCICNGVPRRPVALSRVLDSDTYEPIAIRSYNESYVQTPVFCRLLELSTNLSIASTLQQDLTRVSARQSTVVSNQSQVVY